MNRLSKVIAFCLINICGLMSTCALSNSAGFESHSEYIETLNQRFVTEIDDVDQVMASVLTLLPPTVKMQTTEQYSYFTFMHEGVEYQGNIRIEELTKPILHFAYQPRPVPWMREPPSYYKAYDGAGALKLEKLATYKFKVRFRNTEQVFVLADVSDVQPPSGYLRNEEAYFGQVWDDSGIHFFLAFDKSMSMFMFLLDESVTVPEKLVPARTSDGALLPNILVGIRSGFAFATENHTGRKRLVGVYKGNEGRNNYFDGPFDQLPDSYLGTMSIKDAFERIDPKTAKRIDSHGNYLDDDETRIAIAPYQSYSAIEDLNPLAVCLADATVTRAYRGCFKRFAEF